ncbi:hypothetical protein GF324_01050 [bacterium]|nr:hypothetical protein [bacterium]
MRQIPLLLFMLPVLVLSASASEQGRTVPGAWLDSLSVSVEQMRDLTDRSSMKIESTTHKIDKQGEVKEELMSMHMWVEVLPDGTRKMWEIEPDGTRVKDEPQEVIEPGERDNEPRPLSVFSSKYRDRFAFVVTDRDAYGNPVVSVEPREKPGEDEFTFTGSVTVDTTRWVPVRLQGTMTPLPDKVKELEIDAYFGEDENGYWHQKEVVSKGVAKAMMVITVRFRTVQRMYDWQVVR